MTLITHHTEIDVFFKKGTEDREKFINDPSISKATDYIMTAGDYKEELFRKVGEHLILCADRKIFDSQLKRKKNLFRINRKAGRNSEEENTLFYKFLEVIKILEEIYEPGRDIRNLRGAFLEAMVFKLLEKKFNFYNTKSGIACFVIIQSKRTWTSDRPVDIGFWSKPIGECHECRLKRDIEDDKIKNLNAISSESYGLIKVAITTMSESGIFADLCGLSDSENIILYGRDNIFSICS